MAKYIESEWQPERLLTLPYFRPIRHLLTPFAKATQWPSLKQYQSYLDDAPLHICTQNGNPIKIIEQAGKPSVFSDRYAPRIFLTGEMQTRLNNWHDFFQVITWRAFSKSKSIINANHYLAVKNRYEQQGETGRRSPVENVLSLFDECGAIVVSDDPSLLQHIKNFEWKTLFYRRRNELEEHMQCIIFGHAMYEKMFKPYIGITANALLIQVASDYFTLSDTKKSDYVDSRLSQYINDICSNANKHDALPANCISPLPLLGFPKYWANNQLEEFYDNERYFREGRSYR